MKIKVLPKNIAELIAAGEVASRPASVVKELIENSIDAGAKIITVEIKNGGVTYIRISDDGCGIASDEVATAFLRHATSKISSEDDLEKISTLGFRGEALPSIAAVSRLEIITNVDCELAGTKCLIEGGEVLLNEDIGCRKGTTIIVRDLFFNTPARMKFLKKDSTEANYVRAVIDKAALSHPEVSIKFIKDSKEELFTPGDGKLYSVIFAVYGREFSQSLIPVEYEYNGIKVWGFCSKPVESRANRSMQVFFLNGRFVKNMTAAAALEQAYKNMIMTGKHPACVLNLKMSPENFDVNVHPEKIEVRFSNEKPVFESVYFAVKNALENHSEKKEIKLGGKNINLFEKTTEEASQLVLKLNENTNEIKKEDNLNKTKKDDFKASQIKNTAFIAYESGLNENNLNDFYDNKYRNKIDIYKDDEDIPENNIKPFNNEVDIKIFKQDKYISEKDESNKKEPELSGTDKDYQKEKFIEEKNIKEKIIPKILGEAFETYIITQVEEDILLIDKHAAHERILFEKLKNTSSSASEILLIPITLTLDNESYSAVLENMELFNTAGFDISDFGMGSIIIRSCPLNLDGLDVKFIFEDLAAQLNKTKRLVTSESLDDIYHSVACRGAIKAGDKSSLEELYNIAFEALNNKDIRYCPHGRPVVIALTKKEIEKQFNRLG